ncbi:MAG: glycerate kinase [Burkholderiaceae bacterium]
MSLRKWWVPLGLSVALVAGWQSYGWAGVALVAGGAVMWLLLHLTRLMTVLQRAADRPKGYVGSAVMLNARLREGDTLMHVIALTRSLGELQTPVDTQPEVYRWTDGTQSHVTCEFQDGRLVRWVLERPAQPVADGAAASPPSAS